MRRRLLIPAAILTLGILGFAVLMATRAEVDRVEPSVDVPIVRTTTVEPGPLHLEVLANGTVKNHGFKATSQVTSAHNVRSDPVSKHIYVLGGNNRGMAIFDASTDPVNPKFVAVWNSNYIHDGCFRRGCAEFRYRT